MVRPLGDLLKGVLPSEQDWKIQLLQSWKQIMGTLSSKVRLEKIEDDLLVLGVFDACWMQELYLLSPMLLANINKNLDRPRIKQLRFKRAGIYAPSYSTVASATHTPMPHRRRPLTMSEQRAVDTIVDTQLRDALVEYLERCMREKT